MTEMKLNRRDVIDLWAHMMQRYDTTTKNKNTSRKMKTMAKWMSRFGIMSKKEFSKFSMTLKKVIYINFKYGERGTRNDYIHRVCVCVHEHQHAVSPIGYWRYLTSKAYRARKEIRAYKSNIVMKWYLSGYQEPDIEYYLKALKSYRLNDSQIRKAERSFKALVSQLMRHDLTGVPSVAREAMRVLK